MTDWHQRFMDLAHYISTWSKYPGRHIGSVIADDRHTVISIGYNGSPRGCDDKDLTKYESNVKYFYAEHAERNALYNASRSVIGCTIYSTLFPCADCARAIIQCGITKVVTYTPPMTDSYFGPHFLAAKKMFEETNVEVIYLEKQK